MANRHFKNLLFLFLLPACAGVKPLPPTMTVEEAGPGEAPPAVPAPVVIVAVGDILLVGRAEEYLAREGNDYPFRALRGELADADITFGNLETPVSLNRGKPHPQKEYRFLMKPRYGEGLAAAGFDVLSVANNHTGDFGREAFLDTLKNVEAWGLRSVGGGSNDKEARRPVAVDVRGRRVAFLAYSHTHPMEFHATPTRPGTAFPTEKIVREDVAAACRVSDRVIVSFHWGKEYHEQPNESQRSLAHAAVDAGADAVLGHHPHTFQSVERYQGKPILYSLGNFAFGTRNDKARYGLLARLTMEEGEDPRLEIRPLLVHHARVNFQPRLLEGEEAGRVLERIRRSSASLGTKLRVEGYRAFLP
jgi:poly-gamma-glutamate synthesis protein (capsule biosynthesis protein)